MMFYHTDQNIQLFLDALWTLNAALERPNDHDTHTIDKSNGICLQIRDIIRHNDTYIRFSNGPGHTLRMIGLCDVSDFLADYWIKWPDYSGDSDFPIPGDSLQTQLNPKHLWDTIEGEYRIQLIQFLIQQLSKELNI